MKWILRIGNYIFGLILELTTIGKPEVFQYEVGGASFNLRKGTSDWHGVQEVWRWGTYCNAPGGIVVDIGACVGAYTVYAAGSADRVFGFEPDPESFSLLRQNLVRNACRNAKVFELAVAGQSGKRLLHRGGRNQSATSLYWKMTAKPGIEVEVIPLSSVFDLCEIDRIDHLKVDTEGAEYDLLMEARSELLGKIGFIEVEYHPIAGKSWRKLRRHLRNCGFQVDHRISWHTPFSGIGFLRAFRPK